ncbi:hypothetical protein MKY37_15045 [Psychrobacillus sp. FSL K6-2836]|uniref:hypothetical protein n=1 Tax=Psychrobacillus sp. FSL K6-2836 TaxID=2921548 RepID=UPI0030FCB3BA
MFTGVRIIKDFKTGNEKKVQKVIDERKTPNTSPQPFKFVQSPDLFKKNTFNESRKFTMGRNMKKKIKLTFIKKLLVIIGILGIILLFNLNNITDFIEERKLNQTVYDSGYSDMLEANENDVESLSKGLGAFEWIVRVNSPDDKMIKKYNEIVTLYLEHEEVKNIDIHSLPDARAMGYYVDELEYINGNSNYLGDSQKEMISKYDIEKLRGIVLSYENKEERERESYNTTTTTSTTKYEPFIGMTDYEAIESTWGKPKSINKTETTYGVKEQWVYDRGSLYFEDHYITSIQSSR